MYRNPHQAKVTTETSSKFAHNFKVDIVAHPSSHQSIHLSPADFNIQVESEEGSDSEPEPHSFLPTVDSRSASFSKSKSHRGVLTEQ